SVKKAVVEEDELERDTRKALNYGHTIGHALEALSGFRISHGEAVALGMLAVNELGVADGELPRACARELEDACLELCAGMKLPRFTETSLCRLVLKDKKNVGGKVFLVLPRGIGDIVFRQRRPEAVLWRSLIKILTERFKTA
ncbi:MAG TPA: hypothetical protein PLL10_09145, partial [Elusimicrobiales bacterium]|nr:hypothetical protein [Elusimicrobiales bacterium]